MWRRVTLCILVKIMQWRGGGNNHQSSSAYRNGVTTTGVIAWRSGNVAYGINSENGVSQNNVSWRIGENQ